MRLISSERLRAFVGPEPDKKMSQRKLARYTSTNPSFINHLTSGRRSSCKPRTAELIAEALEVPLEVLFVPEVTSSATAFRKHEVA
jgi:transcriptional regulator with XRE-family HTH domain